MYAPIYTIYSHQSPKSIGHAPVMTENGFPAKSNFFFISFTAQIYNKYICK